MFGYPLLLWPCGITQKAGLLPLFELLGLELDQQQLYVCSHRASH